MEEDTRELYQEIILDHYRKPHNFCVLEGANRQANGHNPLCGDEITLYLKLDNDLIQDASFQGSGCAISRASASLMTESVKGKTVAEVEAFFNIVCNFLMKGPDASTDQKELGDLIVFAGIHKFPARIKCATLSWQALRVALKSEDKIATTE